MSGEQLTDSNLIERLAKAVSEAMVALDPGDAKMVLAIYRLLSRGEPVSSAALAEATSLNREPDRAPASAPFGGRSDPKRPFCC